MAMTSIPFAVLFVTMVLQCDGASILSRADPSGEATSRLRSTRELDSDVKFTLDNCKVMRQKLQKMFKEDEDLYSQLTRNSLEYNVNEETNDNNIPKKNISLKCKDDGDANMCHHHTNSGVTSIWTDLERTVISLVMESEDETKDTCVYKIKVEQRVVGGYCKKVLKVPASTSAPQPK